MMAKLKLVAGTVHEHQAQRPIPLEAIDGRPTAAGILLNPDKVTKSRPGRKRRPEAIAAEPVAALPAPGGVEITHPETAAPVTETTATDTAAE